MLKITATVLLSFIVVAFGQPAWSGWLGLVAAACGFAVFWSACLGLSSAKKRFWLAAGWFSAVQLVQLYWFVSHPYLYIWPLYLLLSAAIGLQFGLVTLLLTPARAQRLTGLLAAASVWTLLEWGRLFLLSGYTWNPVGLSLAGAPYPMQFGSVAGVFGMSFWVVWTNLLALRAKLLRFSLKSCSLFALFAAFPYLYGAVQYNYYQSKMSAGSKPPFSALLVQTRFPIEERLEFKTLDEYIVYVKEEWRQILRITAEKKGGRYDLVVLPELVVPFGTYTFIYPYEEVVRAFAETWGVDSLRALPELSLPLAYPRQEGERQAWMVSNAYWAQALSNLYNSPLVIGLEDAEDDSAGNREYYSSAIYLTPFPRPFAASRYAKRVLVPMGEYIPFEFCKQLAAKYGVAGSFTPGTGPVIWEAGGVPIAASICYEETFGDLMRENREKGAEMLINLTSDVWYPHSRLVWQHLEHARLRTVENGIPLIRACNTGMTGAIDCLGRTIALLGENEPDPEEVSGALSVEVPLFSFSTLYSKTGDAPLIGFCLLALFFSGRREKEKGLR